MATIEEVKAKNDTFICDKCKQEFKAPEVKLIDPPDNVSIHQFFRDFIYVDKNGKLVGGQSQADKQRGDKVLACPKCNHIHLFGFDQK